MLAAECKSIVNITAEGPDQQEAVETLFDMMSKEFEAIYDDE